MKFFNESIFNANSKIFLMLKIYENAWMNNVNVYALHGQNKN